jgi:renalase
MTKLLIIGAGITGLTLAQKLSKVDQKYELLLLEKSRGLGGRLATRRGDSTRFDHGTPEITEKSLTLLGLAAKDFRADGATSLAKLLAQDLRIEKSTRATELTPAGSGWIVKTEDGRSFHSEIIVLTAPLPQALELLSQSQIHFPGKLDEVLYEMAIVALLEGADFPESEVVNRNLGADFLTLVNEQKKGISKSPAWTLTFSPSWSKAHFDLQDEELKQKALDTLKRKWTGFEGSIEIKKWRYSKPETFVPESSLKIHSNPDLYLAGDAFSSIPGLDPLECAVRSAFEVFKQLQSESSD